VLVGFAAEAAAEGGEHGLERAREKLVRKHVDLIVYNDVSRADIGFDATDNEVTLVSGIAPERVVAKAGKDEIAAAILDDVEELLG